MPEERVLKLDQEYMPHWGKIERIYFSHGEGQVTLHNDGVDLQEKHSIPTHILEILKNQGFVARNFLLNTWTITKPDGVARVSTDEMESIQIGSSTGAATSLELEPSTEPITLENNDLVAAYKLLFNQAKYSYILNQFVVNNPESILEKADWDSGLVAGLVRSNCRGQPVMRKIPGDRNTSNRYTILDGKTVVKQEEEPETPKPSKPKDERGDQAMAKQTLSRRENEALDTLKQTGNVTIANPNPLLAKKLGITTANASVLINSLTHKGWVKRIDRLTIELLDAVIGTTTKPASVPVVSEERVIQHKQAKPKARAKRSFEELLRLADDALKKQLKVQGKYIGGVFKVLEQAGIATNTFRRFVEEGYLIKGPRDPNNRLANLWQWKSPIRKETLKVQGGEGRGKTTKLRVTGVGISQEERQLFAEYFLHNGSPKSKKEISQALEKIRDEINIRQKLIPVGETLLEHAEVFEKMKPYMGED